MKILLATYWLLPHVGGVWTYMQQLQAKLQLLGHEVDILARHPDELGYYLLDTDQYLHQSTLKPIVQQIIRPLYEQQLPHVDPWIIDQEVEKCCYALAAQYFGLSSYDLVHAQDVISARALWQIKPAALPMAATIHGSLAADYLVFLNVTQPPDTVIWRYACAREHFGVMSSHKSIVPSNWLKTIQVNQYQVQSEHVAVVPYGMDIDPFILQTQGNTEIVKPAEVSLIICPARLDKVKGHTILLEALAKLIRVKTDWVCWLVGDGYLRDELEQKTQQLGLENNVRFLGNRRDVPALLTQADIFVLPSTNDNQPFSIMEAQIAAKPVIVSDAGGIPEMVDHESTGLVFPSGSSEMLYLQLYRVLADAPLRSKLAANAQQWGREHWSLNTMAARTVEVYQLVRNAVNNSRNVCASIVNYQAGVEQASRSMQQSFAFHIPSGFSGVDTDLISWLKL